MSDTAAAASATTVTVVHACLRDGRGGSPTAVLADGPFDDGRRREIPGRAGASHAVFVASDGGPDGASLRFFTSAGELPACGHGTVAALTWLAARHGPRERITLRTTARTFRGSVTAADGDGRFDAAFDPGTPHVSTPAPGVHADVLAALGLAREPGPAERGTRVAALGRPRLLVPVADRAALAALAPDQAALRAACDRQGLLGCYVYSRPGPDGRVAARMFAPSIGVPEDIANANSTACLAAHLAGLGLRDLAADMGDAVGSPATVTAAVRDTPDGPRLRVGGAARLGPALRL
ncbi:PhzF family phenazine biosynthesis protein [Streptomyces griseosporeus]|uniref:PhzF family phenazine biosynthesis protein n=1 Tax=Streptomyces griseosporeus TaxID=1910 RepID=UPI0036CC5994